MVDNLAHDTWLNAASGAEVAAFYEGVSAGMVPECKVRGAQITTDTDEAFFRRFFVDLGSHALFVWAWGVVLRVLFAWTKVQMNTWSTCWRLGCQTQHLHDM